MNTNTFQGVSRAGPGPDSFPALARVVPPRKPLGTLGMLRTLARNPLELWSEKLYELGHHTATTLGRRTHVVTDPELVQQVLVREAAAFGRAPVMNRALKPALGEALLTADGPHWRWQRRVAAPSFRHDRLDAFVPDMQAAAEATATRWSALPDGATIDLGHEMMRTTFDIIVATMMSGGSGIDVERVERSIDASLRTSNWALLYARLNLPQNTWYPGRARATAARDWMRDLALGIVTRRRAQLDSGHGRMGDLVDLLIEADDPGTDDEPGRGAMADRDIADNLLTFIAAGHETTALALTWAFYALSKHPEWVEKILDEVRVCAPDGRLGSAQLPRLVATRQVVQESLRLYPSAPVIVRHANRAVSLPGLEIREGETVVLPIYVIHRHRRLWRQPDRFDPERFSAEASAARHRYAYLPFGAGPRICIGLNFALNEAVLILATLLSRFDLTPSDPTPPTPVMKITLRPERPMRMVLRRRP
jgi:cytochrome P450